MGNGFDRGTSSLYYVLAKKRPRFGETAHPQQRFGLDGGMVGSVTCTLNVYGRAAVAGRLMLAIDAGAQRGLPSSTALPALALALELGLEAAVLNKFLASLVLQRGRGRGGGWGTTDSWNQMLWHKVDIAFFIAMSEPAEPAEPA